MVAVILPVSPPPSSMSIAKVSAANTLIPAFGGDETELDRKGERYALTFEMPSMSYVESLPWSALSRKGITVVMEVQQPGLTVQSGNGLVKGAGQTGSALLIDGLDPGDVIKGGQFLSVVTAGQRFLYRAAADVTANGSGEVTITLQEMLRRIPGDNDVVEIIEPKIEGYPRDVSDVRVGVDHEVRLVFTVRERE